MNEADYTADNCAKLEVIRLQKQIADKEQPYLNAQIKFYKEKCESQANELKILAWYEEVFEAGKSTKQILQKHAQDQAEYQKNEKLLKRTIL